MQTKKAKYHLKRIETILNLHEDSLSRLDQDILLEDIRHLYDIVLNADHAHPEKEPEKPRDHTYVQPKEKPVEKVQQEIQNKSIRQENNQSPEIPSSPGSQEKQKAEVPEEPTEPTQEKTRQTNPDHTPTTITYEHTSEEIEAYTNNNHNQEPSSADRANGSQKKDESGQVQTGNYEDVMVKESASYPELFDFHSTSDLSDRLANTKIDQLNKILTINDKILYINHLFGGEAIPFQESLKKFENFYTYEEAKKYASEELVENYNWTEKEKADTVRQFMRQVKRLYN